MELQPFQLRVVRELAAARRAVLVLHIPGSQSTEMALAALLEMAHRDVDQGVTVLAPKVLHPLVRDVAQELGARVPVRVLNPEWVIRHPGAIAAPGYLLAVAHRGYGRGSAGREVLLRAAGNARGVVVTMQQRSDEAPPTEYVRRLFPGAPAPRSLREDLQRAGLKTVLGPTRDDIFTLLRDPD